MIITKGLNFNFHTLLLNKSITVVGSVPDTQSYDADSDTYTPDYTITPLTLQPLVSIIDKDGILQSGNVNAKLANIRWYQTVGGTRTQITTDNTDFSITQSGDNAGRIQVKKNVTPANPMTLEFYAEYVDSRCGQIYVIRMTWLVRCTNATAYVPVLSLDSADQVLYNPLRDSDTQVITASLRRGASECPSALRLFVWESLDGDGNWNTVGDDTYDYCMIVSSDGTQLTVDRTLMPDELHIRCRAKYDIGGDPSGASLTDSSPVATTTIKRRVPSFWSEISIPSNIPAGTKIVCPTLTIKDTAGKIDNPEKELLVLWYVATNTTGTPSYTQVANGMSPDIPTDLVDAQDGGIIGVDVQDEGAEGVMADGDGTLLADENGNLIIIK
jgi:hypothetical protein